MRRSLHRGGFTLIELLVVIAILGVLVGLLVPAVQKVREVAANTTDKNNLQQLGYGCVNFNMQKGQFPIGTWKEPVGPGVPGGNGKSVLGSNFFHIRPFIEQTKTLATTPIKLLQSPLDSRDPFQSNPPNRYGLTSYAFVEGIDSFDTKGIVIAGFGPPPSYTPVSFKVRPQDITDGQSTTLMIGPRPPSADTQWGLWAVLIKETPIDTQMAVANTVHPEQTSGPNGTGSPCPQGPAFFGPGNFNNNCDVHHFWSPSDIGGNFCMGDGSVRFFSYGTAPAVMLGAATRAGHENIDLDQ